MDREAGLRAFCEAQYPKLVAALGSYTGDALLAEELAQETLVRVVRDWPRISRAERPAAYAHRMALNLAHSHFRRGRVAARAQARHGPARDLHRDPDTADVLTVRAAIATLPRRQREVVVLRFHVDLPLADIAAVLEVSVGTVKSTLHHSVARLAELLGAAERVDSSPEERGTPVRHEQKAAAGEEHAGARAGAGPGQEAADVH